MITIARKLTSKENLPLSLPVVLIYFAAIISMASSFRAADIILLTVLLLAALHDLYDRTIPYLLTMSALATGIVLYGVSGENMIRSALGCIIAFFVMKILMFFSKSQLGGGDAALITVSGLYTGITGFLQILFTSFVLAGIFSILLILIKRVDSKTDIPFAPFILAGTAILAFLKAI